MKQTTLQHLLNECYCKYGNRPALEVDGVCLTYEDLAHHAAAGAAAVAGAQCESPFVVICGHRSKTAFLGILSSLKAGKGYLPVSHKFPPERLWDVFRISEADTVFLSKELTGHFCELLNAYDSRLPALNIIYYPEETEEVAPLIHAFPRHRFLPVEQPGREAGTAFPASKPGDYAYMLFTSGSTGKPKGIAITNTNVCSYLAYVPGFFGFCPDDRFSQCFDLTFDYSVHDMFCCWLAGACLCVIPTSSLMAPAKFMETNRLTVWFSVPSLAMTMDRMKMLRPGRFDSLRLSLFGGEAVSEGIVRRWQAAAPNSTVYNVYGPTEATINITHYRWNPHSASAECVNDLVPLGDAFPGMEIRIVDDLGRDVPAGGKGELVVKGPQVARGYYRDPERTAKAFRPIPDDPRETWYFTGDSASRDSMGTLRYFGRIDFQVQIRGHRIELGEIEAMLRKAAATEFAVAVPWPYAPTTGRADDVIAVLGGVRHREVIEEDILRQCRAALPDYAVPSRIVLLESFPLNINGKIDRNAIAEMLRGYQL